MKTDRNRVRNTGRPMSGLTLLELMLVLVILTIVATMAVQSLQPQIDSERYQSATRLLEEIRDGVLGPVDKYQVDGTPLISGFAADIGRMPVATDSTLPVQMTVDLNRDTTAESTLFSELWNPSSKLALDYPFRFRSGPNQPVDYSQIKLPCGWRGPYLHLPPGHARVVDPWGNQPEGMFTEEGCLQWVQIQPPPMLNQVDPQPVRINVTTGKVQVTGKVLVDNPEESSIQVALLTPSPASSLTHLAVLDDESDDADTFLFSNVTVGLRALVVDFQGSRSVKYVQVPHAGLNVIFDLTNRNQ